MSTTAAVPFSGELDDELLKQAFGAPGSGASSAPVRTASNPTPVEGTHIPGVQPNGGDDAVKQAMAASATRMPQAPPQDDQLSNLIQQRQQAGQPLDRTNPKYKMGLGGRIAGSLANFASGVAGKGVAVDVGPGAMNSRYYNDTIDRMNQAKNLDTTIGNREKLDEQNRKEFDSATKQAFESQVASARGDTARARQATADAQQQTADVKQQLADQKGRDISWDATRKRFMQNGKIYVPKTIEEGASLEAAHGLTGYYTKLWSQERKNNSGSGSLADELARERMEAQRQKNLSGVQKDIDTAVTRHKAALQKRFDALQFKVDSQEIDPKTPEGAKAYNDAMAGIERDDYKGMTTLGQQFADRTKRFGETVEAPKPRAWEQSFLSPDERAKLLGENVKADKAATPPATPKAALASSGKTGSYKFNYVSKDGKTKIGSNDGTSWFDKSTGKAYRAK